MSLNQKLKKNKLTIGFWLIIDYPSIIDITSSAGFGQLVVDMEHISIDLTTEHKLISTIQANGMKKVNKGAD